MYFHAIPTLLEPIYEMNMSSGIVVQDVLKYYYYGGIAFVGMQKFVKAKEFFLTVITIPARALSKIAVEACKKYLLLNVIINQDSSQKLPKAVPHAIARGLTAECDVYTQLLSDVEDISNFTKSVNTHATELNQVSFGDPLVFL